MARSRLTHLECGTCGAIYPADRLWNLCSACARPLLARYDLEAVVGYDLKKLLSSSTPAQA